MRCNPDLQNPYDCEERTQIQAFIRLSSTRAASPATVNSKARANWRIQMLPLQTTGFTAE